MQARIELLPTKKLIGMRLSMCFTHITTPQLWRSFMPRRKEIVNPISTDLYSVEVYAPGFYDDFSPAREFDKWAAVEVIDFSHIPDGMEMLVFPEGEYAVFNYKGRPSEAANTYRYILMDWLPASGYKLDDRPHFALMGEKYKGEDPESEEEIWIPVKCANV